MAKIKLSDFDFKNIGSWPAAANNIAIVVVGILVFIIGFVIIDVSQYMALSEAKAQVEAAKQKLVPLIPQMLEQQQQNEQFKQLKNLMAEKNKFLATPASLGATLDALTQFAAAKQINISLLKPEKPIQEEYYAKIPINVVATGDYSQLAQFISELAHLNYYLTISKMRIVLASNAPGAAGKAFTPDALRLEMAAELYYASLKPKEDKNAKKK